MCLASSSYYFEEQILGALEPRSFTLEPLATINNAISYFCPFFFYDCGLSLHVSFTSKRGF